MADWKKVAKLGERGLHALTGVTAAQEWLGGLGLAKNAATGNASNFRLGPGGEIMYDSADPRAAASAMGSFVRTDPKGTAVDPDVVKHELRHVRQSDVLGPAFVPAAVFEGVTAAVDDLTGHGMPYGSGALEHDAIRSATPKSEMQREGSSMYRRPWQPQGEAYLRAILGQ